MPHDPTIYQDYANLQGHQQRCNDLEQQGEPERNAPTVDVRRPSISMRICRGVVAIIFWVVFVNFLQAF